MEARRPRWIRALAKKAAIEARTRTRVVHEQVGTSVPFALVTYWTLVQTIPGRYTNSGRDAAWRAGEIYEKRLKDGDRARAAYAAVPERSPITLTPGSVRTLSGRPRGRLAAWTVNSVSPGPGRG